MSNELPADSPLRALLPRPKNVPTLDAWDMTALQLMDAYISAATEGDGDDTDECKTAYDALKAHMKTERPHRGEIA